MFEGFLDEKKSLALPTSVGLAYGELYISTFKPLALKK